jgi:hypothetical protein
MTEKQLETELTELMDSLFEGGWGGGMPGNREIAKKILAKYDLKKKKSK